MTTIPKGYHLCSDGRYRRTIEFDLRDKPGQVTRLNLVRNSAGDLLRTERVGTFRLATPSAESRKP